MAVGLILSSLILASVIGGVGYTSLTRAGVQSQAAADAGIAVARVSLVKGTCAADNNGVFVSAPGTLPKYSASIWRPSGASWVQGCPIVPSQGVKILASGIADVSAVASLSSNDESTVEAIYTVPVVDTEILATGPALYSYSSNGFGGAGHLVSSDGTSPNVFVKTGDVVCNGGAGMEGDLVVVGGNLELSGSCNVSGNVWSSGTTKLTGGVKVGGNVVASAVTINSGQVVGSIWSPGTTSLASATIGGSVSAGPLTLTDGSVAGSVWSTGAATLKTNIKGNVSAAGGATVSNATIDGSVWSASGTSALTGGTVKGDFIAVGAANITGGSLQGNLWSGGSVPVSINLPKNVISAGNITFSGGGAIGGSAWADGSIAATWGQNIAGKATAASLNFSGGNISGAAWASGAAVITNANLSGSLTAKTLSGGKTANGGVTLVAAGPGAGPAKPVAPTKPAAPAAPPLPPTVPDWVDFDYDPADWTGFDVVTMSGGCGYLDFVSKMNTLGTHKGIVDARSCTNGITLTSGDDVIDIKNDLVIVTKKITLSGGGKFTASANRKLWLIQPDTVPNHLPTCPSGWSTTIDGGFTFASPKISVMLYTPCNVVIGSSTQFRGQIFTGSASVSGGATMTYASIGLPGVNLTTGEDSTPATTVLDWNLQSIRNLGNSG
jgi:hypothetical protein